jgi:hypothetical protein
MLTIKPTPLTRTIDFGEAKAEIVCDIQTLTINRIIHIPQIKEPKHHVSNTYETITEMTEAFKILIDELESKVPLVAAARQTPLT